MPLVKHMIIFIVFVIVFNEFAFSFQGSWCVLTAIHFISLTTLEPVSALARAGPGLERAQPHRPNQGQGRALAVAQAG